MTLAQLRGWLAKSNVAAFLHVIREGESSNDDAGYFMRYPNRRFEDLSRHPQVYETTPDGRQSSAAGAYQIVYRTWAELVSTYGFADFSRETQDLAAVALLARRDAIFPLLAGDLDTAISRCRQEWTSLPGAAENQRVTLAKARAIYVGYGGQYSPNTAIETPATPTPVPAGSVPNTVSSSNGPSMLPVLIPVILQALASALPVLGPLFGTGEVAKRNQAVGSAVLSVATAAAGAQNEQAMLEQVQNDKEVAAKVQAAILALPEIGSLLEAGGGGIEGARKAAAAADSPPFWKQMPFAVTLLLMPMVYYATVMVLGGGAEVTNETKAFVIGMIFGGALSGIIAFTFGTTNSSARKDQIIAAGK